MANFVTGAIYIPQSSLTAGEYLLIDAYYCMIAPDVDGAEAVLLSLTRETWVRLKNDDDACRLGTSPLGPGFDSMSTGFGQGVSIVGRTVRYQDRLWRYVMGIGSTGDPNNPVFVLLDPTRESQDSVASFPATFPSTARRVVAAAADCVLE